MTKGTTIWKGRIKTTFARCLMRMDGNGQRWPTARALAAHQRHTQGGTHGEPNEWQAWWSQISASGAVRHMPVLRQHPNTWQQQKDTTDAWLMLVGFTILSSSFFLTPSAHVVTSSLTTQQNSSATLLLWNIRLSRVIH